ncbi:MAG: phage shock protein operon transcriptional activator [Deltaproteobacteria bacterium]|nr:phage shock protein operon transcriptional activator [Deltaproteobacteria bacterium]
MTTSKSSSSPLVPTDAIGQSEVFLDFQEKLSSVARINRPLLLLGERGTGKELAAARLHYLSLRWQEPFVALNCAALSPTLIESELFGHEMGAFTGAIQQRKGRFEAADGGTLFLDEIGMIPLETQEKILRVVEYGKFERVGGSRVIEADVRIVGATNADLIELSRRGKFKRDLLDRLSFEVLFLPPLRERHGDIPLMADHFARRMAYELQWENTPSFSREIMALLENHPWTGNVRELKNVVERAVYRSRTPVITRIDFDPFVSPYALQKTSPGVQKTDAAPSAKTEAVAGYEGLPLKEAVRKLETTLLKNAMNSTQYNQKKASKKLGLTYDQLRGLLRKYKKEM